MQTMQPRHPRAGGDPLPPKKQGICFAVDSRLRGNDEFLHARDGVEDTPLNQAAAQNPDLPIAFIRDFLKAQAESKNIAYPFVPRGKR
jgi:hypothetical protein